MSDTEKPSDEEAQAYMDGIYAIDDLKRSGWPMGQVNSKPHPVVPGLENDRRSDQRFVSDPALRQAFLAGWYDAWCQKMDIPPRGFKGLHPKDYPL